MRTEVKSECGVMFKNSVLKVWANDTEKAKALVEEYKRVFANVEKYFEENKLGKIVDIAKTKDSHIYVVIAKRPNVNKYFHNGEWDYRCWTCWNETTQSLNYGHYDLKSYEDAMRICNKYI